MPAGSETAADTTNGAQQPGGILGDIYTRCLVSKLRYTLGMVATPDTTTGVSSARTPGRPRKAGADEAILNAAIELIASGGLHAATVDAVARRAGVARASVYLRWENHDALITAAVRRAIGREPYPLTGDLERDLAYGPEQARRIFSEAAFTRILPALVDVVLQPASAGSVTYDSVAPNRRRVAEEYRRLAGAAGLRADVDAELVNDLLVGAMLNRLLATGKAPTRTDARQVAEIVLAGLRVARP
jgi:AcrR family transcriptional regulator